MAREYSFIKLGMRSARGHSEDGLQKMPHGALALVCPVCPRDGVNIPKEICVRERYVIPEFSPFCLIDIFRYLYRKIWCLDANFRLKNRLQVNSKKDASLVGVAVYFIDDVEYGEHVLNAATQTEV